ncbi:hypothetical protein EJ05DRAFT_499377 [Pseudovirgaria hyperparasitica]|uniref:BTB domain-containing protein n=1 Tax=Pseudovirgaria hyperparasitica TaxID=470096 RepID=A0A6A6W9W5_9PEZI|nr:uncharacterized protein EJ05DRAFT_499377 [Pseudovirgaria hyperparasitica]KAF2758949.1 hypothetical protein EJ05DRAFT_499377 [Pseudovirgaria hyperparasitica]
MAGRFSTSEDGDVQVILGPREDLQFKVHSQVLRESSPGFFADLVSKKSEAPLGPTAKRQGRPLYHIELIQPPSEQFKSGILARLELTDKGMLAPTNPPSVAYAKNSGLTPKVDENIYKQYKNCFAAMYNKPLDIQGKNLQHIMMEAFPHLDIAEYLDILPIVSKALENVFMAFGQELFRIISRQPTVWLNAAYRMKSVLIFREAVIHTVGKYNSLTDATKSIIFPECMAVIERKRDRLNMRGKVLEARIISLYPRQIQRRAGDNSQRQAYSADVMFWVALGFFRHWFGQAIVNDKSYRAPDGGFQFYTDLAQAGPSAYLDRTVLNVFHNRFNMSKKASQVVENHVLEIKELVRQSLVEAELLSNESLLDLAKHPVDHLTSCKFDNEKDIPWALPTAGDNIDQDQDPIPTRKRSAPSRASSEVDMEEVIENTMFGEPEKEDGSDDDDETMGGVEVDTKNSDASHKRSRKE